jgi:N-methylhydantoinase B
MMNVRDPARAKGDLRAQLSAVRTGEKRFLELIGRYGRDQVLGAIAAIMESSERAARARTLSIPDGTYEAEAFMDDDGIEVGKPIPIRVKVVVAGDRMTVDLTEVARQVRGFYNSGPSTGLACAQVAYKCLTSPTDYPVNDGSFRALEVIAPPGRVVSAVRPAPMRQWMQFPMTIVDTIFKALAPVIPDRVMAGHHASLILCHVTGFVPKERRFFIGSVGHVGGGWGAKMTEDGNCVTVAMNDGDTHTSPVEMSEMKFPFVFERYALVPDSGGAGKFRGGLGAVRAIRARDAELTVSTYIERTRCAPWGLAGGEAGLGNKVTLRLNEKVIDDLPNAKVLAQSLKPGDGIAMRGGGGGGFGSPLARPAEKVRWDVAQGYVSVEAARAQYGVVIDPETLILDADATAALRQTMRKAA